MHRRGLLCVLSVACAASGAMVPGLSWAREAVAEVLGRTIYRDEMSAATGRLEDFIVPALFERFVADQGLTASEAEIDDFLAAMPGAPPDLPPEQRAAYRRVGAAFVLQWKFSKALYGRYGGIVIFQQANPLEPVGALRQFLEDEEASGRFRIFDAADREGFYAYYKRSHPGVVPPADVSYERPWWQMRGQR